MVRQRSNSFVHVTRPKADAKVVCAVRLNVTTDIMCMDFALMRGKECEP